MMDFSGTAPPTTSIVFVCNLPPSMSEVFLADHFGQVGLILNDTVSGAPMIWLYRDKNTQALNGDAAIAFKDPHAAVSAVEMFNNTELHGNKISVSRAEGLQVLTLVATSPTIVDHNMHGVSEHESDSCFAPDTGGYVGVKMGGSSERSGGPMYLEEGRRRGRIDGRLWQQDGDWPCPNSSCVNINFAFRGICNRCGSTRPGGSLVTGGGGTEGGRGRSRGVNDAGSRGRGPGGPPGLFGPNDWNCPMCGNINWAKRWKCNICNTSKPGYSEGGAREGRAGGFKEFDEAEVEETKRRRREKEKDDGEMYDEFGNLKKKFRTKPKVENALGLNFSGIQVGKAGWDKDLAFVEGHIKDKSTLCDGFSCSSGGHEGENNRNCLHTESTRSDHKGSHYNGGGRKRSRSAAEP